MRKGPIYTVEELFRLWEPIKFSQNVLESHRQQSRITQLYVCNNCRLEEYFPQIIGTPDFYVEAYNLLNTQNNSEFTYSQDKWEFKEAINDIAGKSKVFEFGCGNGDFLSKIRKYVDEVAGSEYNPEALTNAKARGLKVFGPNQDLKSLENCYDAVFSFHVLEHTADPLDFLDRMRKTVKPGGMIGIAVPNQDGPIKYIDPCVMNMPPHHATHWRLSAFEALARRLRLRIERVAYEPLLMENHYYYSTHWVRHILPDINQFNSKARIFISAPLRIIFAGLQRLRIKYTKKLKGLSIYVAMSKPLD
jgi:SAM-dependent methyltransferase